VNCKYQIIDEAIHNFVGDKRSGLDLNT